MQYFPYTLRENQAEFIDFTKKSVDKHRVCLHAATGFGKTPAILAALLPLVKKGYKIIWAVRTGNETDRPIEELKIINKKLNKKIFGLSYRGKKDMCLLLRDLKLKNLDYNDVTFLCKTKRKECKYYLNFDFDLEELLNQPLLYSEILKYCKENEICPYLLQRELLDYANVIGLSYNYIIHEGISWSVRQKIPFSKTFLVIDEAHNLQQACENLNSDHITLLTLKYALRELKNFEKIAKLRNLIIGMKKILEDVKEGLKKWGEDEIKFDFEWYLKQVKKETKLSIESVIQCVEDMNRYGLKLRREQIKANKSPHSSLYHLSNFLFASVANLRVDGIAFIATRKRDNLIIELWDMRASEVLKEKWKDFKSCIFCSGTLKPLGAFTSVIGLANWEGRIFSSFYNHHNINTFITKGLTTRGEELSKGMARLYLKSIANFVKNLDTNLAIFSASYRIQNQLINGIKRIAKANKHKLFEEKEGMSGDAGRKILEEFKKCARSNKKGILVASMQGRFAEGADFPGKELEAIYLVGIPFAKLSVKTKLYLDYYKKLYGRKKGTYYAYIVPALRRASQSLGRALRSKKDKAIFVLGDERYKQKRFFNLLPDYIKETTKVMELKKKKTL